MVERNVQRFKALKNLDIIIVVHLISAIYSWINSFVTLIQAKRIESSKIDGQHPRVCNVITTNLVADAWLWLIYYFMNLLIWQYPFLLINNPP